MNASIRWIYPIVSPFFLTLLTSCSPRPQEPPTALPPTATGSLLPVSEEQEPTNRGARTNLTDTCVDEFDANIDYFPDKIALTYASGFSVEYFKSYKLLTVLTPYQGAVETFRYVLVQCGTPLPAGITNAQVIEVPVSSIVSMSSRYLPLIGALGLYRKLVGVDDFNGIYDPMVVQMTKDRELVAVGLGAEVNIEQVIELSPDLVMTYAGRQVQFNAHPKLLEVGIRVAINAEYMENSPLGRAEWIKYVALFFNEEASAQREFDETAIRYAEVSNLAREALHNPTTFWGVPGKDTWYVPGGASYISTLLADAGADYLWRDDVSLGNVPLAFEAVFDRAAAADVWLAADGYPSMAEMLTADSRLAGFAAVKNDGVWSNDARVNDSGGNDYWEGGLANPDEVLSDLIAIFHPELMPDHQLKYWRKLK